MELLHGSVSLSATKISDSQQLKCLKFISIFLSYIQSLMVLKAIYFLDQKYGLALNGESWVIQKTNKAVGAYILYLKMMRMIYQHDCDFHQYNHF